jgi:hypothetical protein
MAKAGLSVVVNLRCNMVLYGLGFHTERSDSTGRHAEAINGTVRQGRVDRVCAEANAYKHRSLGDTNS